jgi:hypothetical protein
MNDPGYVQEMTFVALADSPEMLYVAVEIVSPIISATCPHVVGKKERRKEKNNICSLRYWLKVLLCSAASSAE